MPAVPAPAVDDVHAVVGDLVSEDGVAVGVRVERDTGAAVVLDDAVPEEANPVGVLYEYSRLAVVPGTAPLDLHTRTDGVLDQDPGLVVERAAVLHLNVSTAHESRQASADGEPVLRPGAQDLDVRAAGNVDAVLPWVRAERVDLAIRDHDVIVPGHIDPARAAGGVDATLDTVTCNTFKGTLKFKPGLTVGGILGPTSDVKVKGVLDGCTTSAPVNILPSKVKGTLTIPTSDCLGLLNPVVPSGLLTVKWKSAPALLDSSSTFTPGLVAGTIVPAPWAAVYLGVGIPVLSVTGSFQGGDGGASSLMQLVSSEDATTLFSPCSLPTGVQSGTIGLGQVVLQ